MKEIIIDWINNIQKIEGIPANEIVAFNFGIFENEKGYVMYLVGCSEYDENDDDWASVELPLESYKYLDIPSEFNSKKWNFILEYYSALLVELEKEGRLNIPLLENAIAITIGFDDGDLVKIR